MSSKLIDFSGQYSKYTPIQTDLISLKRCIGKNICYVDFVSSITSKYTVKTGTVHYIKYKSVYLMCGKIINVRDLIEVGVNNESYTSVHQSPSVSPQQLHKEGWIDRNETLPEVGSSIYVKTVKGTVMEGWYGLYFHVDNGTVFTRSGWKKESSQDPVKYWRKK